MKKIGFAIILTILSSEFVRSDYFDCIDTRDYDYSFDYPEVIYLPPEQVENIVVFLNKLTYNSPASVSPFPKPNTEGFPKGETTRYIEETTTTTAATTTSSAETTITATIATTTSSEATTTSRESTTFSPEATITPTKAVVTLTTVGNQELEDPIEDVNEDRLFEREEVTKTTDELKPDHSPEPNDNMETNDYDNDYERDSQEDILSTKRKPEKIRESTQASAEDENNSKPKNIYRWLRL